MRKGESATKEVLHNACLVYIVNSEKNQATNLSWFSMPTAPNIMSQETNIYYSQTYFLISPLKFRAVLHIIEYML